MHQKIDKLSNLLLCLFHASNILEFDFDISYAFDFVALFGGQFGNEGIRSELSEYVDSDGHPNEGCEKTQCIFQGVPIRILLVFNVNFGLLELVFLMFF